MRVRPIGIIHTPFTEPAGTPINPKVGKGVVGTVEVHKEFVRGLKDLDGFDRIWLIFWLHRAREPRLVVTPFLDTVKRGLFATRAPSRPNPIGLSAVRLLRIEGNTLHVSNLDIVDGTPLLDIKPYTPSDCHPRVRCGWMDDVPSPPLSADGRFAMAKGKGRTR